MAIIIPERGKRKINGLVIPSRTVVAEPTAVDPFQINDFTFPKQETTPSPTPQRSRTALSTPEVAPIPTKVGFSEFVQEVPRTLVKARDVFNEFVRPTEEEVVKKPGMPEVTKFGEMIARDEQGNIVSGQDIIGGASLGVKSKRFFLNSLRAILKKGTQKEIKTAKKIMGKLATETREEQVKVLEKNIQRLAKGKELVQPKITIPPREQFILPKGSPAKKGETPISKITLGDDFVEAQKDIAKGIKTETDLPVLLGKKGDEVFVKDGNHRIAEALKAGRKTIDSTFDEPAYLKLTAKPKKKVKTGKQQLAEREATKLKIANERLKREALRFDNELESQFQSFKKFITPSKLDEIEDVAQLKRKIKATPAQIDNMLFSQDQTADEIFDLFKDRRVQESQPLPKLPKETKAVIAEKAKSQIKTAKQVLDSRRSFIRAVQRQFGLSDNDLKKITKRDIRLMDNIQFKKFLDDIRVKAVELADTRDAKNAVLDQITKKELQKVESLRKSMKFPPIQKMSIKQLGELDKELSKAQFGDTFLTQRQIETVKNTDLGEIRTLREAREALAKELNVPVSELDNIKVKELDRIRFDTALAERNPFYKMMVENTHGNMLRAETNFLELETEINDLVRKARKSRKRGVLEKAIPTDKRVFDYISGNTKLAKEMTSEELELANFLQLQFADALDYLTKSKVLEKGRENYITNTRRGFLEAVKEDGLRKGISELFDKQKADQQAFEILDSETGEILPLEKFFQFSLRRTGGIKPTKNVASAATTYFKTLEKKKALDALVPKMMIYVDSLTPPKLTPKGLEMDRSLKKFVTEWINNKKGRRTKLIAKQGGKIDIALNTIRSFLYFKDLALSLPVGLASLVGEQVSTFVNLGNKQYLRGVKRRGSKQGRAIIEKYKNFIGKNIWEELAEPSKNIKDKFTEGMFGLFSQSTAEANKLHLLGSLTDAEFKAGKVTTERLAQMKLDVGRFRMLSEGKSIIGSTAEGQVLTQYKTWAIPIFRTLTKDLATVGKKLAKGDFKKAITSEELKEIVRAAEITSAVIFLGNKFIDEEDDSYLGKLTKRLHMEALTILGALDTRTMLAAPRLVSFVENLGQAISSIIKLEEYKTKEGLVGVQKLKREFTPGAIRQFQTKKKTKKSKLDDIFQTSGTKKKSLDEIFK